MIRKKIAKKVSIHINIAKPNDIVVKRLTVYHVTLEKFCHINQVSKVNLSDQHT